MGCGRVGSTLAHILESQGHTVATVRWTADQMMRRLLPHGAEPEWRDPSGTVRLAEVPVDSAWVGERISRLEIESGGRVAFLTRLGEGLLPGSETVLQDGDIVHVVMRDHDADAIESVFRRRSTTPAEGGA